MKTKKILALLLAAVMALALCGCGGGTKSYTLREIRVTLGGEQMHGPGGVPDGKLTIVDGKELTLAYSGGVYRGTVVRSSVIWDRAPEIVSGGTLTDTSLVTSEGAAELHYSFYYESLPGTVTMVFRENR